MYNSVVSFLTVYELLVFPVFLVIFNSSVTCLKQNLGKQKTQKPEKKKKSNYNPTFHGKDTLITVQTFFVFIYALITPFLLTK
jgi:quinol-cytochrome oxidoreductase complex cytochrome b subunit